MDGPRITPRSGLILNAAKARFFASNTALDVYRRLRSLWRSSVSHLPEKENLEIKFEQGACFVPRLDAGPPASSGPADAALYLDLMKRILANIIYSRAVPEKFSGTRRDEVRRQGGAWPQMAHTMIGLKRLDNLQFCVEDVIEKRVPGDFIETGVWRGGACIFMRAVLKAHGVSDRIVWLADSFEGLPKPDPDKYPEDAGLRLHAVPGLAVSVEEVMLNFREYGLLDQQVRFIKGWFRETLPKAPVERLAVLRLDGDMYESTIEALEHLYPRLSVGGYVIVDDYRAVPGCRLAVDDFRKRHSIAEKIEDIDWSGVFWKRER